MPHTIVIFGASGDLTSRKLVPALYNLMRAGSLPSGTQVVGFSRTPMTDDEWRATLRESTAKHAEGARRCIKFLERRGKRRGERVVEEP